MGAFKEIRKDMYELPHAVVSLNIKLIRHLIKYVYHPTPLNPDLCKHILSALFMTVVDFSIEYSESIIETKERVYCQFKIKS